jgi:hypothetical protein
VIDPADDALLVIAGLAGDGTLAESIEAISLGTGVATALQQTGDTVSLGPISRAVWEPTYRRTIVLGGSLADQEPQMMLDDTAQVFAVTVSGGTAALTQLPVFPEGGTADIPLPAAVDPTTPRLFAIADKGSTAGPMHTYVLDVSPGHESWSLFHSDPSPALANVELVSMSFDPVNRRLLGMGATIDTSDWSMWALSIDAPSAWKNIPGIVPASIAGYLNVLGGGLPLAWDDTLCTFVVGATGISCEYEVWRFDIGDDAFVATPLGDAAQPDVRYSRGIAGFDPHRRNFVFPSAFDCDYEQDYVALSTDFLPVVP